MSPEQRAALVAVEIRRTLRVLVVLTLVLYFGVAGLAIKTYSDSRRTEKSLCTLRTDLKKQVRASVAFLADHPEGLPKAGITAKQILDGVRARQSTIKALDRLNCPAE